jgi:Ca2+-transporting ATPase
VIVGRTTLDEGARERVLAAADALARGSLRVLAMARRTHCPADMTAEAAEAAQLEFLGLVGMHDPPSPEVADAVRRCRGAGIRVVMVTGDHGLTAEAIAQRSGLVSGRAAILDGPGLDALDDGALVAALAEPDVLVSRVNPERRLRIATALHAAGEVVAMTGDGVNDAPALRAADIGVAMGRSGADVAREAADIILLDDSFASIAAAVEEGRAVYDNIRRFAQYHFSSNVAELLAFLTWGLSGGAIPLPIVVMKVLAVDLGTDLLPAIALGTERAEPGIMERAPRSRSERLLNRRVLGQVGAGMAFRTSRESIFKVGLLSNRFLLVGIALEIALLFALLYVPALQSAFHMRPLDGRAWLLMAVWPVMVLAAEEARKAIVRRRAPAEAIA